VQCLRLAFRPQQGFVVEPVDLRIAQASGWVDPEPFRRRAVEGPALAEPFAPSGGMRTLHCDAQQTPDLFDLPGPILTFVLEGRIDLAVGATLGPGDVFLVDGARDAAPPVRIVGECRLLQVLVGPDWPGERTRPLRPRSDEARSGGAPNFKRMFEGADARSYFRAFDALFAEKGQWSPITPLIGIRFIGMAADTFIDWHPEIVNNFVVVMTGGLELEAGGGEGQTEVFWPGDICLAEDRTGQGHIDRMHGHVQVAVLIVANEHLWR